jgi:capsid assembly protease
MGVQDKNGNSNGQITVPEINSRISSWIHQLTDAEVFICIERANRLMRLIMSGPVGSLEDFFFFFDNDEDDDKDEKIVDGIGILEINGPIYNEDPEDWWVKKGYEASYKKIRQDIEAMQANDSVKVILGKFNSPGGIGSGLFDLMDDIYAMRGKKPMIAYVDNYGFSAAQGLMSAFDETWASRHAEQGSIGSIIMHTDISEALKQRGIKVETFTYGKKKDAFANFKPLSDDAKKEYKDEVTTHGKEFTELVARNFGLPFEMIRELEAGILSSQEAVKLGLTKKIIPEHKVMAEIKSRFKTTESTSTSTFFQEVKTNMNLKELKEQHPDAYDLLVMEVKMQLEAEHNKKSDEMQKEIDRLKDENSKQAKQIEDNEKKETIRKYQAAKASGEKIVSESFSAETCKLPKSLSATIQGYVKVENFIKEDNSLDEAGLKEHVVAEIKKWEDSLKETEQDADQGGKVDGFGTTPKDAAVKEAEAAKAKGREMAASTGAPLKKKDK